jgi:hypothetical protein
MRTWWTALLVVVSAACVPNSVTPEKIDKIKVCSTTYEEVRKIFGKPDSVGRSATMVTWRYGYELAIAFDNDSIVVDYAYKPVGLVELRNRCAK